MKSLKNKNCVYILSCSDSSLYTGWTNNLEKRLASHNKGQGAKYTRGRRPCSLVYFELMEDRSQALKREAAIKKLSRSQKLNLIEGFTMPDLKGGS